MADTTKEFSVSLIGGIIILANGINSYIASLGLFFIPGETWQFLSLLVSLHPYLSMVFGIMISIFAFSILRNKSYGPVMVMVFAVLSVAITGGGWIAGSILTFLGGYMGRIKMKLR